jgi:trimethylamine--corrinoid protein Co-methyltransferase
VLDAEAIGWVQRLLAGLAPRTPTLATEFFAGINFKGEFLKQKATRQLFSVEQNLPSPVIDRDSIRGWQAAGSQDAFTRAKARTQELLAAYRRPAIDPAQEQALTGLVQGLARQAGMEQLPNLD